MRRAGQRSKPDLSAQQQQIFKRHLRVVDTFRILTVSNTITRNFQRLTHGVQMKSNYSRRQPNGWYPAFSCEPSYSRFANLQMFRKLPRG